MRWSFSIEKFGSSTSTTTLLDGFSLPPPSMVATLVYSGLSAATSLCSQVKDSFAPRASFVEPDGWMFVHFASDQRAERQRHVPGVFNRDQVVDGLADFGRELGRRVVARAPDPLFLADREVRFFRFDADFDFVGFVELARRARGLPVAVSARVAFFFGFFRAAFDRGHVRVHRFVGLHQRVFAGEGLLGTGASSVWPEGAMFEHFASVRAREVQRHVARVFDRDLVFHGLADFAGQFRRRVAASPWKRCSLWITNSGVPVRRRLRLCWIR